MHSRQVLKILLMLLTMAAFAAAECDITRAAGERPSSGRILFDRGGGELWVMDGDGSHARHVLSDATWSALNPDAVHLLHWDGKAVRILSLKDGCDTVVDDTIQGRLVDLGWSRDGKTLAYVGTSRSGSGLHVLPFPVAGVPRVFEHFNHVALSSHGQYALLTSEGVSRLDLRTGQQTKIGDVDDRNTHLWGATYRGDQDIVAELDGVRETGNDNNSLDCRGANTTLRLRTASSVITVPFPDGFDSTLEYEIDLSQDGNQLAVSFGADRCDYPGDVAAVYLFSLSDHSLLRVSPKGRLAGRVKFSPDGKALIYTDFRGTGTTTIYRYDLLTKQLKQLTAARQSDYDYVVDWR